MAQQVAQKLVRSQATQPWGDLGLLLTHPPRNLFPSQSPFLLPLQDVIYSHHDVVPVWDVLCPICCPFQEHLHPGPLGAASPWCPMTGVGDKGCTAGSPLALSVDN